MDQNKPLAWRQGLSEGKSLQMAEVAVAPSSSLGDDAAAFEMNNPSIFLLRHAGEYSGTVTGRQGDKVSLKPSVLSTMMCPENDIMVSY
jgi:hypothetical protein